MSLLVEIQFAEIVAKVDAKRAERDFEGTFLDEILAGEAIGESLIFAEGINDRESQACFFIQDFLFEAHAHQGEGSICSLEGLSGGIIKPEDFCFEAFFEAERRIDESVPDGGSSGNLLTVDDSGRIVGIGIEVTSDFPYFQNFEGGKEVETKDIILAYVEVGGSGHPIGSDRQDIFDHIAGMSVIDRAIEDDPFEEGIVVNFVEVG